MQWPGRAQHISLMKEATRGCEMGGGLKEDSRGLEPGPPGKAKELEEAQPGGQRGSQG